ncbi:MAG: 50S ribosomal protein L29 [Brachymonas sp.]|jgi:large subunit ribosomal protein L29
MAKKDSKVTSAADLRSKDDTALQKEIADLQRAHFNLRMQKGTQQLTDLSQMRTTRRSIARAKTVLAENAAKQSATK